MKTSSEPASIWTTILMVNPVRFIPKDTRFTDIFIFILKMVALGTNEFVLSRNYACVLASCYISLKMNT